MGANRATTCQHRCHRRISEREPSATGQVWQSFECLRCGEVGVLRSGGTSIEWTGPRAKPAPPAEKRTHSVLGMGAR
jgi:hypothetical protein